MLSNDSTSLALCLEESNFVAPRPLPLVKDAVAHFIQSLKGTSKGRRARWNLKKMLYSTTASDLVALCDGSDIAVNVVASMKPKIFV